MMKNLNPIQKQHRILASLIFILLIVGLGWATFYFQSAGVKAFCFTGCANAIAAFFACLYQTFHKKKVKDVKEKPEEKRGDHYDKRERTT